MVSPQTPNKSLYQSVTHMNQQSWTDLLRRGQPAAQMNVVAMMPGQCILAMRVPTETVKDSGFRPMPSTPSTGTPPSTSDEEAEDVDMPIVQLSVWFRQQIGTLILAV